MEVGSDARGQGELGLSSLSSSDPCCYASTTGELFGANAVLRCWADGPAVESAVRVAWCVQIQPSMDRDCPVAATTSGFTSIRDTALEIALLACVYLAGC